MVCLTRSSTHHSFSLHLDILRNKTRWRQLLFCSISGRKRYWSSKKYSKLSNVSTNLGNPNSNVFLKKFLRIQKSKKICSFFLFKVWLLVHQWKILFILLEIKNQNNGNETKFKFFENFEFFFSFFVKMCNIWSSMGSNGYFKICSKTKIKTNWNYLYTWTCWSCWRVIFFDDTLIFFFHENF